MVIKPIIDNIKPYSADKEYILTFSVFGGNQIVGSNLVIERISDNKMVYNETIDSLTLSHNIEPNKLINGINYRAKIKVKDGSGKWSDFSDAILFWCLSDPIISDQTIDDLGRVNNQTVIFNAKYEQKENEVLELYRYLLYDSNKTLIKSFDAIYDDGSKMLTQEITGLENGKSYYVEVITMSVNGQRGTSGLNRFTPHYIVPKIAMALHPKSIKEDGAIKLQANIVQIFMDLYKGKDKIEIENVEYLQGEELDLNNKYTTLKAGSGFKMSVDDDYFIQLWVRDIKDGNTVLVLEHNDNTKGYLIRKGNYFTYIITDGKQGVDYSKTIIQQFISNEIMYLKDDDKLVINLRYENGLCDLQILKEEE